MAGMVRKSLDSPEETRAFEAGMGKLELVNMEGGLIGDVPARLAVVQARQAHCED